MRATRENIRRSSANIPTAGRLRQQSLDRRWRARFSLPSCDSFSTTALDRSFLSFLSVCSRDAARGEEAMRSEAKRSDAFRGLLDTAGRAAIHTALIRIRAPVRRAFSRKSIRRVRFSDFDGRRWRNARKSRHVAQRRNATITHGSFCFLFSSKSS